MAAYTLSTEQFPSVRAAIGFDVDALNLPDSVIALPIYKGEAERYVMRHLTEAVYENPAHVEKVRYAATLYLASLIAPSLRIVSAERITGGHLTYEKTDLIAASLRLAAQAAAQIADILEIVGVTVEGEIPQFFSLAHRTQTNPFDRF